MEVKQPIFIVGTGRCGSTIFQQIMCEHPDLAWLSALGDLTPGKYAWNGRLMKAVDWPLVGPVLRRQKPFRPWEPYRVLEHCAPGFAEPCRDLTAMDVTEPVKKRTHQILSQIPTKKRDRLLVKITGWPRIGFLQEIFPDAKFVHILRDGRAVVNSLLNVNWWSGWRGPQNWRWGDLTPAQQEKWEQHQRSFVALAAIEWNILMDSMETAKQQVSPESFLEIKYEQLCADPMRCFQEITSFCELDFTDSFANAIQKHSLRNSNAKWQKDLTFDQQAILHDVMGPYLTRYEYEIP